MGFDQYHEPAHELPDETRTFARLCASLTEEAEAIGWYEQRIAVETDREARAIMRDAQGEEFKHFAMNLEFLLRRTPLWREIAEPAFRSGHDAAIIGHFHHAYERREPGREFFLLGDWIERFTYLELAAGKLELKTWPAPALATVV